MYFRIMRIPVPYTPKPVDYYASKPSINEIFDYEMLDLYEAAFILTGCWPKYITKHSFEKIAVKRKIPRTFIYAAAHPPNHAHPGGWKFNPDELGHFFSDTYNALRNAVNDGEIQARMANIWFGAPKDRAFMLVPTNPHFSHFFEANRRSDA